MELGSPPATNVIRFPGSRSSASPRLDQSAFMDAVYAAGSLPVAAEDHVTKAMAMRLTIFGFVVLDEVQADGTTRRLRPSEAWAASPVHPWRVSKRQSRYSIDNEFPATDLDLFAALA